jgi:ABC-type Fe3+/spermidine/putrescine transport system ATPase subunit
MTVEALGVQIEVPLKETEKKEGLLAIRPHHIVPKEESPTKAKIIGKQYQGDRIDYMLQVQDHQLSWITDASEEHHYQVDDVIGIEFKKSVWLDD